MAPPVEDRADLYLAQPGRLLQAVREVDPDVRRLAVVGHEPTQSMLTTALADDSSDPDAVEPARRGLRHQRRSAARGRRAVGRPRPDGRPPDRVRGAALVESDAASA
ncbi:hypothetical protein GCM10025868_01970 [Angustibacter aerolatus]|uniref:Phosphohistidine phosphatase SixA n=1 Tax=Angustibacter aerolatus TaxID=1162965 RepID=A0ABQ6JDG5_9ACTN|nr:hypothetical protein GCM10025868_01970 [Angustibacter aerolatus]